jgi:hypothetical protein
VAFSYYLLPMSRASWSLQSDESKTGKQNSPFAVLRYTPKDHIMPLSA